ncbi:MAG TPA: hypothetical protein VL242_44575 [Sorangium sp.]|nr:hypothetical protein [Sorangium sp.]
MLSRIIASMSSSVISSRGRPMPRPTLLIQTSTRPNRAIASSKIRCTSSRFVTSATTGWTWLPQRLATSPSGPARRAASTTDAPRRASSSAAAAPTPPLAP